MRNPTTPEPLRRLFIADVEARLGYERTSIYRWYKAGKFPEPHYLGVERAWFLGEIEAWEVHRMAALANPAARRGARNLKHAPTPPPDAPTLPEGAEAPLSAEAAPCAIGGEK